MGSSSTTPSAPTIDSANKPLYPSSSNTNLSAKGGGLIHFLAADEFDAAVLAVGALLRELFDGKHSIDTVLEGGRRR
jgi:hypothetical protein